MFNGLIEDWYTEQLGVDYAKLILNDRYGYGEAEAPQAARFSNVRNRKAEIAERS